MIRASETKVHHEGTSDTDEHGTTGNERGAVVASTHAVPVLSVSRR
ncbi:MAG: hypothetical protein JNM80_09190 [Phycisphaerae bacterium]|nr:hypothetical protein [Phycisphaerae bacterium]